MDVGVGVGVRESRVGASSVYIDEGGSVKWEAGKVAEMLTHDAQTVIHHGLHHGLQVRVWAAGRR